MWLTNQRTQVQNKLKTTTKKNLSQKKEGKNEKKSTTKKRKTNTKEGNKINCSHSNDDDMIQMMTLLL